MGLAPDGEDRLRLAGARFVPLAMTFDGPAKTGAITARVIDSHLHFDLAGANRRFLVEAGVPADRIEDSGLCTYDERDLLHSFRREGTGAGHHALCAGFPDAPGDPEEPTPPRRA